MIDKKLFVVASGSGGHIVPAIVLARRWKELNADGKIWFFTGNKKLDKQIIEQAPEIFKIIILDLKTFSLKEWWGFPVICVQLLVCFFKSLWLVIKEKPEKIITTGGLSGLPLCIAGKLCGVTIDVYELNAVPGKAVKALLPIAHKIYTPFTIIPKHYSLFGWNFASKCAYAPYPLRSFEPLNCESIFININSKLNNFAFSQQRKTLLVIGGSQGSSFLNRIVLKGLEKIKTKAGILQVIHQAGSKDIDRCREWYNKNNIPALVFDFDFAMSDYFLIADLVISRAGAGTLFELVHFKKKSIIIPLITSTTNHQKDNAYAIAEQYPILFTVIEQSNIEHQNISKHIDLLCQELGDK